ncbi:MAG: hypothetical protein OEX00_01085 [Gammaproteobacteria bacterium]|nr:hypothetical protein [Gammaproteobacteria bacterium]MDH5692094.1 hypothetical protein [Gammaproteobacteria bacterium]
MRSLILLGALLLPCSLGFAFQGKAEKAAGENNEIRGYLPLEHYQIMDLDLSIVGIPELMEKFGNTKLIKGTHGTQLICYEDKAGRRFVYERTILGFGYSIGKEPQDDALWSKMLNVECATISSSLEKAGNKFGLTLGMAQQQVIKLMGATGNESEGAYEYRYWTQETKSTKKGDVIYDIYSILTLHYTDNKLSNFSIFTTLTD